MYYYKLCYSDNTYCAMASKQPIRNPKHICDTCIQVQIKSIFWYFKEWLIEKYWDRK